MTGITMKGHALWILGAFLLLFAAGCCCPDAAAPEPGCGLIVEDHNEVDDDEVAIAVDQLPAAVRAAALAAVPGLVIEEAARETQNGITIYDVEGEAHGKEFELEITDAGKVLEVEEDTDDDDEGDDEKDDD